MQDETIVEIVCSQCDHEVQKNVAWIKAHHGTNFVCEKCGALMRIDADAFTARLKDAEASHEEAREAARKANEEMMKSGDLK